MCTLSQNVISVEVSAAPSLEDKNRVRSRLNEADTIVFTNYYNHKSASNYYDFIMELHKTGKKIILISNTVYELTNPPEISTVIVVGTPAGRENLKAAAELLYGKIKATGKLPVKN